MRWRFWRKFANPARFEAWLSESAQRILDAKEIYQGRKVLSDLLVKWGAKGRPRSCLVEKLEREVRDWSKIKHPQRFVERKFRAWIGDYTPTPTPAPYSAEYFDAPFQMPE